MRAGWEKLRAVPTEASLYGLPVYYPRYPAIPRLTQKLLSHFVDQLLSAFISRNRHRTAFDLIHASWLYPEGVAAVSVGRKLGIPVVLTALGSDANELAALPLIGQRIRDALVGAAAITGVSRQLCDLLGSLSCGRSDVVYTPNGVDDALFKYSADIRQNARRAHGPGPHVAFVGRLEPVKDVALLLQAWRSIVSTAGREAKLVIVGEGSQGRALRRMAVDLGVAGSVTFVGTQSREAVRDVLAAADLVCLPSRNEGMPNVVVEAIACGTPVVASRVGGIPDLVGENCGNLFEPGDQLGLERALIDGLRRSWDHEAIARGGSQTWHQAAQHYLRAYEIAIRRPI
jgi:glycosyltransferase involved in cell wall biosynthesis